MLDRGSGSLQAEQIIENRFRTPDKSPTFVATAMFCSLGCLRHILINKTLTELLRASIFHPPSSCHLCKNHRSSMWACRVSCLSSGHSGSGAPVPAAAGVTGCAGGAEQVTQERCCDILTCFYSHDFCFFMPYLTVKEFVSNDIGMKMYALVMVK